MTADTFDILVSIVQETGWVCKDCRMSIRLSLRCAKLAEEVAGLTASQSVLKKRIDQLEKAKSPSPGQPIHSETDQIKRNVWTGAGLRATPKQRHHLWTSS